MDHSTGPYSMTHSWEQADNSTQPSPATIVKRRWPTLNFSGHHSETKVANSQPLLSLRKAISFFVAPHIKQFRGVDLKIDGKPFI